jgi:hypothetical protein
VLTARPVLFVSAEEDWAEQSATAAGSPSGHHPPALLCLLACWLAGSVPADLVAATVCILVAGWLAGRSAQEHHTAFLARHAADHRARHALFGEMLATLGACCSFGS